MVPKNTIEKRITRNIYGKAQTVKAIFPSGLGEVALNEVQSILASLWFEQKFKSEGTLAKNDITITPIHISAASELMLRSLCLTDVRLVLAETKVFGKKSFEKQCRAVPWDYYINENVHLKIKVTSIASTAFHETALKNILANILNEYTPHIVSGEQAGTTCLYVNLYKNKVVFSLSLAGEPLYKRGYRDVLKATAPLREDIAASCMRRILKLGYPADSILVPFSGTGTFAFEYLQIIHHLPPVLFGREYALQKLPLFRAGAFNFLVKKAKLSIQLDAAGPIRFFCIDSSRQANEVFKENLQHFNNVFLKKVLADDVIYTKDFLTMDVGSEFKNAGNIFMPINPPYGIRLNEKGDTVILYKKIADKIKEIAQLCKDSQKILFGFILCPTKESWSAFVNKLTGLNVQTYHITQGGLDVRVCEFYYLN